MRLELVCRYFIFHTALFSNRLAKAIYLEDIKFLAYWSSEQNFSDVPQLKSSSAEIGREQLNVLKRNVLMTSEQGLLCLAYPRSHYLFYV